MQQSSDKELPVPKDLQQSQEWIDSLHAAAESGIISNEERSVIDSYRNFLRTAALSSKVGPQVTEEERRFLDRWKARKKQNNKSDHSTYAES